MSEVTAPLPPAPLVPVGVEYDELVATVTVALAAEVNTDAGRDHDRVDRAVRTALEQIEAMADLEASYATVSVLPTRFVNGAVTLAAAELRRPGMAYGLAGYDPMDNDAARTYATVRAMLVPGLKDRFGLA